MALTKSDFIRRLKSGLGDNFTTAQVQSFYDAYAALTKELLLEGQGMSIQGVVTLETKVKAAHNARNPKTGETCRVEARLLPKASFNANLKLALRSVKVSNAASGKNKK